MLHCAHLVQLERIGESVEEFLVAAIYTERELFRFLLLKDVSVDECLNDLGIEDFTRRFRNTTLASGARARRFSVVLQRLLRLWSAHLTAACFDWPVKLRVELGNCVQYEHQLAEEAAQHRHAGMILSRPAIDLSEILLQDILNWSSLVDELFFNLLFKASDFFSPALCLSLLLAAHFLTDLVLTLLLFCFATLLDTISVRLNCVHVRPLSLFYVVSNQRCRVLVVRVHLHDKLLRLLQEPGHDVALEDRLFESVAEEANVTQELKRIDLHATCELLGKNAAHHFLVRDFLSLAFTALQTFLGLISFEFLLLSFFHLFDLRLLVLAHVSVAGLLLLHFGQFFLLEHFHSGDFKGFAAEHRQNGLNLIVKEEELVVLSKRLF